MCGRVSIPHTVPATAAARRISCCSCNVFFPSTLLVYQRERVHPTTAHTMSHPVSRLSLAASILLLTRLVCSQCTYACDSAIAPVDRHPVPTDAVAVLSERMQWAYDITRRCIDQPSRVEHYVQSGSVSQCFFHKDEDCVDYEIWMTDRHCFTSSEDESRVIVHLLLLAHRGVYSPAPWKAYSRQRPHDADDAAPRSTEPQHTVVVTGRRNVGPRSSRPISTLCVPILPTCRADGRTSVGSRRRSLSNVPLRTTRQRPVSSTYMT